MSAAPPSRLGALAVVPLALFALAIWQFVAGGLPVLVEMPWVPSLGITASLRLDGWALQFVLLITGIGTAVLVYAAGYLAGDPDRRRVFGLLLAFMAAMLGCVTTDDLVTLFVFWELTSLTSYFLVGTRHEDASARGAARQALLVTGGGGLVLLAGLVALAQAGGSWSITELLATAPAWVHQPIVPLAVACVLVGAFTKSAQFPFHFWLPNAMSAPTPVSAYLHSATMVKLGVYLLGRLHPAFDEFVLWQGALVLAGSVTAIVATLNTLRERDLKRILAWSTVAALGTLVMLIGMPGDGAATATSAFLLAHALYKAPLFFVAGNVDHAAGTRSIDRLSGLARAMPLTAAAALLAATSMAGMPLSFGFVAKDLITIAKEEGEAYAWAGYASLFVSAVSVAVAATAAIRVFWQRRGDRPSDGVHEGGLALWLPPLAVAGLGIVLGPLPHLVDPLIGAAAQAMRPTVEYGGLTFSPGEGPVLVALGVAIGAGAAIYLAWDDLHRILRDAAAPLVRIGPTAWYAALLRAIPSVAGRVTRALQHGRLTGYTTLLVGAVAAGLALALWRWFPADTPAGGPLTLDVGGATALVAVAALAACRVRDAFVLLLASGLVGLGSALLYLFLGAPDLAFTQFAVEVAFVVVIAAILLRVRRLDLATVPAPRRSLRAALGLAAGLVLAALVLASAAGTTDPALSRYFAERAVPEAFGRNVVNVILVDFRALDTLGEITVVAATLLGGLPLIHLIRSAVARGRERRP